MSKEIEIFTSNFAVAGTNPMAVSIAVGNPPWYRGNRYPALAPTRAMLKMSSEEYLIHYDEILSKLDPEQVVKDLGDGAIMLCWEGFNIRCHRRYVAEWIERHTGIVVVEFNHERADSLPFAEQRGKNEKPAKTKKVKDAFQGFLF